MRLSLLANACTFAVFIACSACFGICRWEFLLFQLLLQALTNELWMDVFTLPFRGRQAVGAGGDVAAGPAFLRRVARRRAPFLFLFPLLLLSVLYAVNEWGGGALAESLHVPLEMPLVLASLSAQGVLFMLSFVGGLQPLSYRTLAEALMARRERVLSAGAGQGAGPAAEPPTRAGVESLPHGLPAGVQLPDCLAEPQCCSPLYAFHTELVRARLREGELAILSTAPAGVVPLPSSSNERSYGGLGLCLAALLLYTAIGLFEEGSSRVVTRWVVALLGLGLLPASVHLLRSSARRQAALPRTDYFLTNYRLHICCAGRWLAVPLVSLEALPGGSYGEGCGDVELCPESGAETYTLVNVEHAEELCALLERLIYMENAR